MVHGDEDPSGSVSRATVFAAIELHSISLTNTTSDPTRPQLTSSSSRSQAGSPLSLPSFTSSCFTSTGSCADD
jgi:hypothetical protein